jgi:hypothetical protein
MVGYIIASVLVNLSHNDMCMGLMCWRWAFLIEIMLLTPLYIGLYFVPGEHIQVCVDARARKESAPQTAVNMKAPADQDLQQKEGKTTTTDEDPDADAEAMEAGVLKEELNSGRATQDSNEANVVVPVVSPLHLTPDERTQHRRLRTGAISASMYDPLSTRLTLRKASDRIALLGEAAHTAV